MYINDSDDLREAVLKVLKTKGIKPRLKREPYSRRRQHDSVRGNSIIFRIPLEQLPSTEVCLDCGAYVSVPCIVVQLCDRILGDIQVEGIFRKNGSQARQHDIKVMLEKGGRITSSHHVIDVAVLLKEFLRCLPVPLIPYNFHDDFLKCLTLSDKCLESILLLTLVLPPSHLNVLAYVMQFFAQISSQSNQNKMNAHNLSVVIAPNVMPSTSRNTFMCANGLARAESCRQIVEDLIINASPIGLVPASVQTHPPSAVVNTPNEDFRDEHAIRRKRRSASLTRMFSGFKRMVAKNNAADAATGSEPGADNGDPSEQKTPVPPVAVTSPGGKKRKMPQEAQALALGFSAKKRKELMRGFAEHGITLLSPKILIPEG
uniref:Rho GTPase-activating protein 11A n=3 Tax=Cacopsylla melanoneura TaxID=428564 RepID=A0A8D9AYP7_9HEMI